MRVGQPCPAGRTLSAECFRYSGEGDELITPVYLAPTLPPYQDPGTDPWPPGCQDDEDCPGEGEGSGQEAQYRSSSTTGPS